VRARPALTDFAEPVSGVAYNPRGTLLATHGADGTVRLWKTGTYEPYATLTGHQQAGDAVAFHPSRNALASVADDGTVRIWSLDEDEVYRTICSRDLSAGRADWDRYAPDVPPPAHCG
jgi:WD40 repeat protein